MSICLQYNFQNKTCTVVVLDDGGNFRQGRFEQAMSQRQELHMREDPFSVHVLFFSETMQDWTFSFEVLQKEIDKEVRSPILTCIMCFADAAYSKAKFSGTLYDEMSSRRYLAVSTTSWPTSSSTRTTSRP
jgi:hypothetical protein